MKRTPPPRHVLEAYRLTGDIAPTHTRDAWRVGSVALKRVEHPAAVEWASTLLASASPSDEFRIPSPIPASDGRWIVDGWAASKWIQGKEDGSRWRDILEAGTALHEWLSDVERPMWIDQVDDPWRVSDRMAWDEHPIAVLPEFMPLIEQLTALSRPVAAVDQLVHGDLTGNVLFSEGLPPGIIDLSLYWRPPLYATAIVAVDCYEWEGVGPEVLDYVAALPDGAQLLVRAALFRIVRAGMVNWTNTQDRLNIHRRTVAAIEPLLA